MTVHTNDENRTQPIRVLVADDSPNVVKAICDYFKSQTNIEVIATAEDGLQALEQAKRHKPDLLVMDVNMPRLSGIEACKCIHSHLPQTKIILISIHDQTETRTECLRNHANAFVSKIGMQRHLRREIDLIFTPPSPNNPSKQEYRE